MKGVFILIALAYLCYQLGKKNKAGFSGAKRSSGQTSGSQDREPIWDAHEILGLSKMAKTEDIRRAYREKVKQYHPDKVASLGRDLQDLAHQKMLDIQKAYRELLP